VPVYLTVKDAKNNQATCHTNVTVSSIINKVDENRLSVTAFTASPNPFGTSLLINYNLLKSGEVTLTLFDQLGKEVKVVQNSVLMAGNQSVILKSEGIAAGTYILKLKTNTGIAQNMVVIKQ
jgi:hypothetical protein